MKVVEVGEEAAEEEAEEEAAIVASAVKSLSLFATFSRIGAEDLWLLDG